MLLFQTVVHKQDGLVCVGTRTSPTDLGSVLGFKGQQLSDDRKSSLCSFDAAPLSSFHAVIDITSRSAHRHRVRLGATGAHGLQARPGGSSLLTGLGSLKSLTNRFKWDEAPPV